MAKFYTQKNFKLVEYNDIEWIKQNKKYKRGVYSFNSDELPKCNICGSDLSFIKRGKGLIIDKCLNENCISHNKGNDIKLKAFLPEYLYKEYKENRLNNNSFNIEYLVNKKGLTIEEANNYIKKQKNNRSINAKKKRSISFKDALIRKYGVEEGTIRVRSWNKLCKEYWITRGYTEEEAKKQISNEQSKRAKNIDKKYFLEKGRKVSKKYLLEQGKSKEEVELFYKERSYFCKEYWIKRGYTEEEAKEKVKNIQSINSKKSKHDKSTIILCKEYWIKRGYTEEEAIKIISERQRTFSKEKCINKYGYDKGIEIFNNRQIKWQKSLHNNGNLTTGYSKVSQELFNRLYNNFINNDIRYATLNKEYSILDDNKLCVYDYVDITNKKIIEFNGDLYHANPKIYNSNDKPNPFNNVSSEDIWKRDKLKYDIAIKNGFELMYVWENEYRKDKEKVFNECLKFLSKNE